MFPVPAPSPTSGQARTVFAVLAVSQGLGHTLGQQKWLTAPSHLCGEVGGGGYLTPTKAKKDLCFQPYLLPQNHSTIASGVGQGDALHPPTSVGMPGALMDVLAVLQLR